MKKLTPPLLMATAIALFSAACQNSGGDSWPIAGAITPQPSGSLTLAENQSPYAAIINVDNITPPDTRATLFYYIIENNTSKNYGNMVLSLEPENPAKYLMITEGPYGGECVALSTGEKCDLTIIVASHSPETISLNLKITSDQGEEYKNLTPIVSKYHIQPNTDSVDFGPLSAGAPAEKTFLLYNAYPYESSLRSPGYLEYLSFSRSTTLSAPEFTAGAISSEGFSIDNDPRELEFTAGEKIYSFGNCYPGGSAASLKNSGVSACYVKVKFNNTVPGTYSDELAVKFSNPSRAYKEARVRLTATVN